MSLNVKNLSATDLPIMICHVYDMCIPILRVQSSVRSQRLAITIAIAMAIAMAIAIASAAPTPRRGAARRGAVYSKCAGQKTEFLGKICATSRNAILRIPEIATSDFS